MNFNKNMKSGDHKFLFSEKVGYCKKFVNQSVIMRFSNVKEMTIT